MLIGIFDLLGAQTDRFRCEVCQNLILSPMNTGLLRPAVATVPTVYGIETWNFKGYRYSHSISVATVPTVYGIETQRDGRRLQHLHIQLQQYLPFTVLKPIVLNDFWLIFFTRCNSPYRLRY